MDGNGSDALVGFVYMILLIYAHLKKFVPNSLDFDGGQRMKSSLEKVWHTPVICLHGPANVAVSSTCI